MHSIAKKGSQKKRANGVLLVAFAWILAGQALPARCSADETVAMPADSTWGPAQSILMAIADDSLRLLTQEVLSRNPAIAAQTASVAASAQRISQAEAFPDPMLGATIWIKKPETRVGPQNLMLMASQQLPWFGKRKARGNVAASEALAAAAGLDAVLLRLLTETRKLYYELAFLEAYEQVVREDRATLVHYEEVARARYASGAGIEQSVVKIQAEITMAEARLLEIETQRSALRARINALRDRAAAQPVGTGALPRFPEITMERTVLRDLARANRPEVEGSNRMVERWSAATVVANKESKPDLNLGVLYGFMGERTDAEGRANPPMDNGMDDFGITAEINVPLWRGKYSAGVEEARQSERMARENARGVLADIDAELGDLLQKLPLTADRLRLFEDVLEIQATQSLRSAEAGYAAGTLNALELLDAERVLLDVRIAAARARADYAIALAELEGTVATPLGTGR